MLNLIRIRKVRVPNTLAIAAAILLGVSSLAGTDRPAPHGDSAASLAGAPTEITSPPALVAEAPTQAPARQARKFRVNLFLFRH